MRLFSKTKSGDKIIFSFLGIRVRFKVKVDTFLPNIIKEWRADFHPIELEQKLKNLILSPAAQKDENKEIFLILISTLLENGKEDEAISQLTNYINKFGLEHIACYPLVACLAHKLNLADDRIKQCVYAFNILEENRLNKSLEKLLKGKTLAVVGNSPNLIGKQKGPLIDSADIVVRFNNFCIQNYEADYGTKTNIWVSCQADDIAPRSPEEISKMDFILYNIDMKHCKIKPQCLDYICQYLKITHAISYIDATYKKDLKQYGFIYPSSGLTTLYHLQHICSLSRKNIFGFSFLENSSSFYAHYFQKQSKRKLRKRTKRGSHNIDLEIALLNNIFP